MLTKNHLLRLARRLAAVWPPFPAPSRSAAEAVCRSFVLVQEAWKLKEKAHERGWTLAALTLDERSGKLVRRLVDSASAWTAAAARPSCASPCAVDFYRELQQLHQEFGEVAVDWRRRSMSVRTSHIELVGVSLGVFAIHFEWSRPHCRDPLDAFSIEAIDPRPAEEHDGIVHPHVRDQVLCPGDAEEPLRKAFEEGRLADCFLLIRGVLENYNPRSAYVSLESWEGVTCGDCGSVSPRDDSCFCEGCQQDHCSSCVVSCESCGTTRCRGCMSSCEACGESYCRGCLSVSGISRTVACENCRRKCEVCGISGVDQEFDEAGLCSECAEAQAEESSVQLNACSTSQMKEES